MLVDLVGTYDKMKRLQLWNVLHKYETEMYNKKCVTEFFDECCKIATGI